MPLHSIPEAELRDHCRRTIENLENWLRRLVDEQLSAAYGDNYFKAKTQKGENLLSQKRVTEIAARRLEEPRRFRRLIDAAYFDDLTYIVCRDCLYKKYFCAALEKAFPEGASYARGLLKRIQHARNALSHANPISVRHAEQVICYSNDIIDSLKSYYEEQGMQREYNVPSFVRATDSFGSLTPNDHLYAQPARSMRERRHRDPNAYLRPGDVLTIEVEIDPSFPPETYAIEWVLLGARISTDRKITIEISEKHVRERLRFSCRMIGGNDWHRFGDHDDKLIIDYKVLPPL